VSLFFANLATRLASLLPVRLLGACGAGLGSAAYYLLKRHRRIALRNLARVYPQQTDQWRRHIARASFAELGRTTFELPHIFHRSREFLLSRLQIEGEKEFRQAMQRGEGVILNACHHSNWELLVILVSMLGYKSDVIYRPLNQPCFDTILKQARERFGARFHPRQEGLRWLAGAKKEGHCILVIIDQHLSNGEPVPFLGHMANTTMLPATFAGKYNTPTFGIALNRIGSQFRFKAVIWPISNNNVENNSSFQIMKTICDSFTPVINQRPELWLWLHRRWLILDHQEDGEGEYEQA
jgi:KDO2-lipid IV(A) lauroyltransferase